ncbi:hypothetical protein A7979_05570 [Rothia nasimurium]|uniref:CopG family transcriptional regulator n=1 Tax=Rothia nasimurium TaxID=85336 RepID=A0A1Y1RNC9_9MICC|nr:DUF6290 family protein [Rothia nasimurium]ORC16074.1 hypothetical protein A7979_05570 [Rothia nasimurium]
MTVHVEFTATEEAQLQNLSSALGTSTEELVRSAVLEYLEQQEEQIWAQQALARFEVDGREMRPAQELWDELGV